MANQDSIQITPRESNLAVTDADASKDNADAIAKAEIPLTSASVAHFFELHGEKIADVSAEDLSTLDRQITEFAIEEENLSQMLNITRYHRGAAIEKFIDLMPRGFWTNWLIYKMFRKIVSPQELTKTELRQFNNAQAKFNNYRRLYKAVSYTLTQMSLSGLNLTVEEFFSDPRFNNVAAGIWYELGKNTKKLDPALFALITNYLTESDNLTTHKIAEVQKIAISGLTLEAKKDQINAILSNRKEDESLLVSAKPTDPQTNESTPDKANPQSKDIIDIQELTQHVPAVSLVEDATDQPIIPEKQVFADSPGNESKQLKEINTSLVDLELKDSDLNPAQPQSSESGATVITLPIEPQDIHEGTIPQINSTNIVSLQAEISALRKQNERLTVRTKELKEDLDEANLKLEMANKDLEEANLECFKYREDLKQARTEIESLERMLQASQGSEVITILHNEKVADYFNMSPIALLQIVENALTTQENLSDICKAFNLNYTHLGPAALRRKLASRFRKLAQEQAAESL